MSRDLVVRHLPQAGLGRDPEIVLPAEPEPVFALVIDYTQLEMEELESIRTLIGGGNGPVVKLNHAMLLHPETTRQALMQLVRALLCYPCTMLFLLVPCEMPGIASVIQVMEEVGRQRPTVCLVIGRKVYAWEMAMTIDPLSEEDAELRQDPELNSSVAQWTAKQPWFGEDIAGMIDRLRG